MTVEFLIVVLLMSLFAEYVGATFGMGYGTTLTPILILMGLSPLGIVPAILFSQVITGLLGAYLHHGAGNVSFDFKNDTEHRIVKRLGKLGYIPRSMDSRVAMILGVCSVLGVVLAVSVALHLPVFYLKLYIGVLVLAMGVFVMIKHRTTNTFSWKRLVGIGFLASFNKGISGGGYRAFMVSGQILSGINAKSSVGITSLTEGITCSAGVLAYFLAGQTDYWRLVPPLLVGSLIAVPLSVYTVKKIHPRNFTLITGMATAFLGTLTLIKITGDLWHG